MQNDKLELPSCFNKFGDWHRVQKRGWDSDHFINAGGGTKIRLVFVLACDFQTLMEALLSYMRTTQYQFRLSIKVTSLSDQELA